MSTRGGWEQQAACVGMHDLGEIEDRSYHDHAVSEPSLVSAARRVCGGCPVSAECLATALERGEKWGMWGGHTPLERQRLRQGRDVSEQQPRAERGQWSPGRVVSDAVRRQILDLTGQGLSAVEVSAQTGVRVGTVVNVRASAPRPPRAAWLETGQAADDGRRVVERAGRVVDAVTGRFVATSDPDQEARVAELRAGPRPVPVRQVAAVLGVSKSTAARVALRVQAGLPVQREP